MYLSKEQSELLRKYFTAYQQERTTVAHVRENGTVNKLLSAYDFLTELRGEKRLTTADQGRQNAILALEKHKLWWV